MQQRMTTKEKLRLYVQVHKRLEKKYPNLAAEMIEEKAEKYAYVISDRAVDLEHAQQYIDHFLPQNDDELL